MRSSVSDRPHPQLHVTKLWRLYLLVARNTLKLTMLWTRWRLRGKCIWPLSEYSLFFLTCNLRERPEIANRKRSVASIAKTNPGDGTKRLYGEESYIHDDIVDSPVAPPGRARVVLPVTPTKPRFKKTNIAPAAPVRAAPPQSVGGEEFILLSDTDPRGSVHSYE